MTHFWIAAVWTPLMLGVTGLIVYTMAAYSNRREREKARRWEQTRG